MTAVLLLSLSLASAQDPGFEPVTEEVGDITINWTDLRLEITSTSNRTIGAWQSWQGQEQEVMEFLQSRFPIAAKDVVLRPGISAGMIMNEGSELGLRTEREATKWHIEETRYHTSGGVEMDAYLDLKSWLGPALRDNVIDKKIAMPEGGSTGLVIDARAVRFRPALSPTVVLASGNTLVHTDRISLDTLESSSAVLYVTDPADPRALDRAGLSPLFALAQRGARGSLELQSVDWESDPALMALVANGRVVIITDSHAEPAE